MAFTTGETITKRGVCYNFLGLSRLLTSFPQLSVQYSTFYRQISFDIQDSLALYSDRRKGYSYQFNFNSIPVVKLWQQDDPPVNLIVTPHNAFYTEPPRSDAHQDGDGGPAGDDRGKPRNVVNGEFLH
jgi:hypothetical protein